MARRAQSPFAVLVLGLVSVALLGGFVIYYTGNTPILRLRPVLEQRFGVTGVRTRFVGRPGQRSHIEVDVPAAAAPDQERLVAIGVFALAEYQRLAQPTSVQTC